MIADYLINAFATLFLTVDSIGLAPMFLAVTAGTSSAVRRSIAVRTVSIAAVLLMVFLFGGKTLLSVLGISVPAFQVSGRLLLFYIAFEMIFARRQKRKSATADKLANPDTDDDMAEHSHDIAAFPLAIPLIASPASISAVILLASQASDTIELTGLIVVTLIIVGSCFAIVLLADHIERYMGNTVQLVLTRLLGVLLTALSVQFVADGVGRFSWFEKGAAPVWGRYSMDTEPPTPLTRPCGPTSPHGRGDQAGLKHSE
ncbi:MarC family protein [Breoghania sp.]|uniref:MarC family protein n=1 Tax=Breoghania sp. TaxID=2065378 RepID=UPI0026074C32|nr:MarC family protein [Breoghania sp.]MDJ0929564.1 MarC family protein [Breoghania sp.]